MKKILHVDLNDKGEPMVSFGKDFTFGYGLEIGVRLITLCQEQIEKDLPAETRKTPEEFLDFIMKSNKKWFGEK